MENSLPVEEFDNKTCYYAPQIFLEWKLFFVGVCGFITALVSIIHNCILFYTFNSSKLLRRRNLTYLMWISLCDIFISLSYIAIMCVQVYFDYFESMWLFVLWHRYLVVAFTVSHITLSSSSFLLMAATIERYLQSTGNARSTAVSFFLSTHRGLVVFLCFLAGIVFRGTVCLEIKIVHQEECVGFASYFATVANLTDYPVFDAIWKFWVRKIISVFLPFAVLAYFNAAIVVSVRRTDRDQTVKTLILYVTVGNNGEVARLRSRLRTVTRMLVMVVCCYLCANILDVIIAAWENIDPASLMSLSGVYAVTTDISSFLPILACALRLPIYTLNDKDIRMEVFCTVELLLHRICACIPFGRQLLREKRKFYDAPIDTTIVQMPTRISNRDLPRFGMSSLIMARAALCEQEKRRYEEENTQYFL